MVNKYAKTFLKVVCIVLGVIILLVLLLRVGLWWLEKYTEKQENTWYVTEETEEYGEITHNGHDEIPAEFIHSFFPEEIEPYFENVKYRYKARDWCDYCCEMYLEFTISDRQLYTEFTAYVTRDLQAKVFPFDDRYDEYIIDDKMVVVDGDYLEEGGGYYLNNAQMGKILVCKEEQKIVYHAVMVTGCCGTNTDSIEFYQKYDIDPLDYTKRMGKRQAA